MPEVGWSRSHACSIGSLSVPSCSLYSTHWGLMRRIHDDVIKWKHLPRLFVRGTHRLPVNSPHKGQWRGALIFSLFYAWINAVMVSVKWIISASSYALLSYMYITIYTYCWDKTILRSFCLNKCSYFPKFPTQRPVTRSFDVSLICALNKRLSKQSWAGDLRLNRAHYDVIVMRRPMPHWVN